MDRARRHLRRCLPRCTASSTPAASSSRAGRSTSCARRRTARRSCRRGPRQGPGLRGQVRRRDLRDPAPGRGRAGLLRRHQGPDGRGGPRPARPARSCLACSRSSARREAEARDCRRSTTPGAAGGRHGDPFRRTSTSICRTLPLDALMVDRTEPRAPAASGRATGHDRRHSDDRARGRRRTTARASGLPQFVGTAVRRRRPDGGLLSTPSAATASCCRRSTARRDRAVRGRGRAGAAAPRVRIETGIHGDGRNAIIGQGIDALSGNPSGERRYPPRCPRN